MSNIDNKFKPVPFWSWNDELDENELVKQIDWMYENGIGGFFMHARGGLKTPYLGEKWFSCVETCLKRAKELNMEAYAYDENGWPSGFVGGKLLEDPQNCDMYVEYKIGAYDEEADVAFDISTDELIKTTSGENVLNIYLRTSSSTADICNPEVVRKFIDLTHEEYKKHNKYGNLRGFFTDEPEIYRWATSYTRMLPEYFLKHYNENIYDRIGLLFVEKEGYRDFRYKYFKSLQDLMLNSFAKQIYEWCDENNMKLTGHYIEESNLGAQVMCCGGIMPFYEYEHIPGIDFLGRDLFKSPAAKQLGSVMSQLGKKQGLGELFACAGWDCTPLELKAIAELLMIDGVNLLCHHLLPYSEHGQRKRDYPEHYSAINPWVNKNFKEFNDHFSKIGKKLATSTDIVEVGLLQPLRSVYFDYKREIEWANGFGAQHIIDGYDGIYHKLNNHGVQFHILDEVIMAKHAHVEGDTLVVGNCRYKYIVICENTLTMDKTTEKLFREFANNGGKFYIVKDRPTYLEGAPFEHDYMTNTVTFKELVDNKKFKSLVNTDVRIAHRIDEEGKEFFYVVNLGEETDFEVNVKGYSSFECEEKVLSTNLHLNKYQSMMLYPSNKVAEEVKQTNLLRLKDEFKVVGTPKNYLTLDYLFYSTDGINYSKKMHYMGAFNLLIQSRYQGEVYLKYDFEADYIPSTCELLLEDTGTLEVAVNGVIVDKTGTVLEKDLWKYDIAKTIKLGKNEVTIKINFANNEQVYSVLLAENLQESLKNCLAYDTTIEAIYLAGDFGVSGDFKQDVLPNVLLGNSFKITSPNNVVKDMIQDGYPFFRGTISLEQEVEVADVNQTLLLENRFQLIDLFVNNQFVKRLMFDYKVDLSNYLNVGKNTIRMEYVVSNRNLLGPHHALNREEIWVGPHTFERLGSWDKEGNSQYCLTDYSFVKPLTSK